MTDNHFIIREIHTRRTSMQPALRFMYIPNVSCPWSTCAMQKFAKVAKSHAVLHTQYDKIIAQKLSKSRLCTYICMYVHTCK